MMKRIRTQPAGGAHDTTTACNSSSTEQRWCGGTGSRRPITLRPYQHAALLAWNREKRGVVVLPTGAGRRA
jgi:superfamily II DNA or RNA helicase